MNNTYTGNKKPSTQLTKEQTTGVNERAQNLRKEIKAKKLDTKDHGKTSCPRKK